MKSRIHINQHVLRHNRKHNTDFPPCTIKQGSKNRYAREVIINGPSKLVYAKDDPLSCGAVLWIETESSIDLIDETDYLTIKTAMSVI